MSNTPDEIRDHRSFFKEARGRVLINGLGLGIALNVVLHKLDENGKPAVTEAIVVEKSPDVIDLVQGSFKDKRIKFVLYDALEYKAEGTFDAVWHDIWPVINASNLKDMQKLHRKYGRKTNWQGSWCRRECERHL
jgi:spermidine synthase